jgi:uncharacterized protein (DUF486 family)
VDSRIKFDVDSFNVSPLLITNGLFLFLTAFCCLPTAHCSLLILALMLRTILLLTASNIFMTTAWYYHLKHTGWPLWKAILLSWAIAFFEYCLMVPANRLGYVGGFNTFQLKMVQEVITLLVFSVFAVVVMKESFQLKYLVSFIFLLGAVYFMFKK